MLLADLGADVVGVEPPAATLPGLGDRTCSRSLDRACRTGLLCQRQPQQAQHLPRSHDRFRSRGLTRTACASRRSGGELPRRGHGPLGAVLRAASRASPTWSMRASAASGSPHRTQPVRGVAGLRHDRAGHGRRHEGHGDRCRPSRQGRLDIGDLFPAALAAFGLLAAVRQAEASGERQLLDVVMYDAVLSLSERIVYQHSMTGTDPVPTGEHAPAALPVRSRGDRGRLRRGGRAVGPPLAACSPNRDLRGAQDGGDELLAVQPPGQPDGAGGVGPAGARRGRAGRIQGSGTGSPVKRGLSAV